ncbi:MAG: hypothetical protein K0Q55_3035 [Verrucomicrobia bacterium]|nr:hypothetical protein [Verrucomicrobiota bacterium]
MAPKQAQISQKRDDLSPACITIGASTHGNISKIVEHATSQRPHLAPSK